MAALVAVSSVFAAKKVFIIESYHVGYPWSDGLVAGAEKTLKAAGVEYKIVHMDTKRNPAEEFKKSAAAKVKAEIDAYAPDGIIACDDNANKYVVVPNYKNGKIPVAFAGVNWDATAYGFPCSNVTGMLEVAPFNVIEENMKKFAKGARIGYLGVDNETSKKEASGTETVYGITLNKKHVKTFAEWKTAFTELQGASDWIYIENFAGINDFDTTAAKEFVLANTKIPTVTIYDFMLPYTLMGIIKDAGEQGEFAANAVVKMMSGTPASAIPVGKNKRADLALNMKIAKVLGVTFDMAYLKQAKIILK
jgi:ABC-type uncharacterized transport system substrate-binding protein